MKNVEYVRYDNLFPDRNNSLSFGSLCYLCSQKYNFIGENIIWGNGPEDARIMIIGKDSAGGNPAERLWKGSRYTGIPLTNKKSGAKLRILLYKAGVNPHKIFFTNMVKCNTGYDKLGLSYEDLVQICIQHLIREIKLIKPQIIVCLGRKIERKVHKLIEETLPEINMENCKYLQHPSRVEGEKKEADYVNKIKEIIYKLLCVY
jgi:uracil-DNA glycosylase family 4